MNEILFFIQIILIVAFAIGALRLGESAVTAWVAIQALVANIFVLKQICLFGFDVTASDAFSIGSLLGLNFLQEYFSKDKAMKATWICFFFMLFFTLVSQVHLLYIPNIYDNSQFAFFTLLSPSPRLLIASMSVFLIVQRIDVHFFAFLKKTLPLTNFATRAAIALVLSQFLDTVLFSIAGLYGMVTSIVSVILMSFLIKLIVICCFTPILRLAKHEATV